MAQGSKAFEFGEFVLDTDERVLYREDRPVPITPKTFLLLRTLIEKRGKIVEREELFQAVWGDTNVEEGNLAFTIRLLRKALGDTRSDPGYIETVPRRGYRFIADVRESTSSNGHRDRPTTPTETFNEQPFAVPRMVAIAAVVILIVFVGIVTFWLARQSVVSTAGSGSTRKVELQPLSADGKTFGVVISPDGKNIVYRNQAADGRESVWFRQLESGNNVELIPASNDVYFGFAFSPDSNFVYFARRPKTFEGQADIFRISIFGGIPKKIAGDTQGWMSVSYDGRLISFVRCFRREDENCALWTANAETGGDERRIVSRPLPSRISVSAISPKGASVAFAVGYTSMANDFELKAVDLASGEERLLANEKFFNIKGIAWLPDERGLLISARKGDDSVYRLCHVKPDGSVEVLTNDPTDYSTISMDRNAQRLVSDSIRQDFKLRIYDLAKGAVARELASAEAARFVDNETVVFGSSMTGNVEIWAIKASSGERTQLTSNQTADSYPVVSRDGRTIYFVSTRTGKMQIFRMGIDGSETTQLSSDHSGFPMFVSPDGDFVYYLAATDRRLWRVATDGSGIRNQVLPDRYTFVRPSRSGDRIVTTPAMEGLGGLIIVSLNDGSILHAFEPGQKGARIITAGFLREDSAVAYVTSNSDGINEAVWLQKLDGSPPELVTDLNEWSVQQFEISPDGSKFATIAGNWKRDALLVTGLF